MTETIAAIPAASQVNEAGTSARSGHGEAASPLMQRARAVAERAHAPYSQFRVGAAVLAGGQVFAGCNVENASYGLAICAERNAVFQAVAAGHRSVQAVALSCIDADGEAGRNGLMPCGACRQVLAEFAADDVPVEVDRVGTFRMSELLPNPFRL